MQETLDELGARTNAHRQLLVHLVTLLAGQPGGAQALERLAEETESVVDHEEDPGVTTPSAYGVQARTNAEMCRILRDGLERSARQADPTSPREE
ncbi:hypothetical protein [Ensifer soli]|uniref:hypothetical protein n=1 Tax=Ciceribacter sp. sgz301302 TaxID=3342379 RepID=UPI0035B8D2BB